MLVIGSVPVNLVLGANTTSSTSVVGHAPLGYLDQAALGRRVLVKIDTPGLAAEIATPRQGLLGECSRDAVPIAGSAQISSFVAEVLHRDALDPA